MWTQLLGNAQTEHSCDGWVGDCHQVTIKSIDLINRYFYRSKYKLWLPKQIKWESFPYLK